MYAQCKVLAVSCCMEHRNGNTEVQKKRNRLYPLNVCYTSILHVKSKYQHSEDGGKGLHRQRQLLPVYLDSKNEWWWMLPRIRDGGGRGSWIDNPRPSNPLGKKVVSSPTRFQASNTLFIRRACPTEVFAWAEMGMICIVFSQHLECAISFYL